MGCASSVEENKSSVAKKPEPKPKVEEKKEEKVEKVQANSTNEKKDEVINNDSTSSDKENSENKQSNEAQAEIKIKEEEKKEEEKEEEKQKEEKEEEEKKETIPDDREEVEIIRKEEPKESFGHQTGGHAGTFHKVDEQKIMKKVGKNEFQFYQEIHNYPSLQILAPQFFGVQEKDENNFIIIQDLTHGFKKPCILDVKIGRQSFGEDASPEKKESMEAKDKQSTTFPLGARITAMKVYQNESQTYISKGKSDGKKVTVDGFQVALSEFFHNGTTIRKNLIPLFLEKLTKVVEWAETQGDVRVYSSSVLFIYDGEIQEEERVELKLIDFAHVHKIQDEGKDEGYIFGIKNLAQYLTNINETN